MTLREYLFESGLTQAEFAEQMKVSPTAVANWISGKFIPRPAHIRRIRTITHDRVDIWTFFRDSTTGQRESA